MRSTWLKVWVLVFCAGVMRDQASAKIEDDIVETQGDMADILREMTLGSMKMMATGKWNTPIYKGWATRGQSMLVKQVKNFQKYNNGSGPGRAVSDQVHVTKGLLKATQNFPKLDMTDLFGNGLNVINSIPSAGVLSPITGALATVTPLVNQITGSLNLGTAMDSIQGLATSMGVPSLAGITDMGSNSLDLLQIVTDSISDVDALSTAISYSNLLVTLDPIAFASDLASYSTNLVTSMTTAPPPDVCYTGYTCFSMKYPWYSATRPLPAPQSPTVIGVEFQLFSRGNRAKTIIRSDAPYSVKPADYNGTKPTVFIVHGKADDGNANWAANMKEALLTKVDANVIIVDWGKGAKGVTHMQAASNVRVVGAVMTAFGNYLIQQRGANVKKMHLVGDGTGAHAAGYMGKAIPNIGRITGLDIDGNFFETSQDMPGLTELMGTTDVIRLTADDAIYVDVYHTSGLPAPLGGSGAILPHGDKDFYINGGARQPGCPDPLAQLPLVMTMNYIVNSTAEVVAAYSACSHGRASLLYTASIGNSCIFVGRLKDSDVAVCTAATCSAAGYDSLLYRALGEFDVATTQIAPFCARDVTTDQAMIALQSPLTI